MQPALGKENLKRAIGAKALALAIINMIVGTGIFVIPSKIAADLGGAAILAYLICGALVFLIALCVAEVGSRVTHSGGAYAYIETAFGPFAGFLASNLFVFASCMVSDAAIANALADTLKYFFPALGENLFRIIFFVVLFAGLAWLNIRSVKHGVRFVELVTFLKIIPLLILILVGTTHIKASHLQWDFFPDINQLGASSLFLFFAFLGVETPIANGGEMKNPQRTIPLGIFWGISFVLIFYIAIQLLTQGVLGGDILLYKDSPLAAVAGVVIGKAGVTFMIVITALSMIGGLGGEMLSIPRILYAGARDGVMLAAFAKVHKRFFTPYVAIASYSFLGMVLSMAGGFRQLAIISTAATLLIYLGIVLSCLRLRRKEGWRMQAGFRIPGGIIVPCLALATIVWLLSHLSRQEFTGLAVFIGSVSALYFLNKFFKRKLS